MHVSGEDVFLHLPERIEWKGIYDNNLSWLLIASQPFAAERDEFVLVRCATSFGDHYRDHLFAQLGIRHAKHGHLGDRRVLRQYVFDLARVDIVASTDDELAQAPRDGEIAVATTVPKIPGLEPAVSAKASAVASGCLQ